MSIFRPALDHILDWEDRARSGIVTHDEGGRTRLGIAEKFNAMPENFWTDPVEKALALAAVTYRARYFNKFSLDELSNQAVTNYVADCMVNPGPGVSIKLLQVAANGCIEGSIAIDGEWGPATRAAINAADPKCLLETLSQLREAHYRERAAVDPNIAPDLNGLLARAKDTHQ